MHTQPTASPTRILKIAVLGTGSIGSTFAFQLARAGHHEVTVIARPGSLRLEQLQRDGAIVNTVGERAEVNVADKLDQDVAYDLVIVTLLAHQVGTVLPALKQSAAKGVLFMFNVFDPEALRDALGAERSAFGMPFVQAQLNKEGHLKAKIGAGGQTSLISDQRWVDVFVGAGLPARFEPKMLLWLRCHAPMCVAFESVSVSGVRRGGGASWSETQVLARGLQESFVMIQRMGYPMYPAGKVRLSHTPAFVIAGMLWGMSRVPSFRELLATGANECRALVDVLVAQAAKVQPPVEVARIAAMKP